MPQFYVALLLWLFFGARQQFLWSSQSQLRSVGSCVIATLVAHATTPGNANSAIAIATTSEEVQSSWEAKLDL